MIRTAAIVLTIAYFGLARGNLAADLFVDHLLATSYLSELEDRRLDPADLDPFRTEFEADRSTIVGGTVRGRFEFSKGRLTGLARARRASPCEDASTGGRRQDNGTTVAVSCSLEWDELRVQYDGRMRYGKMPRVRVDGRCVIRGVRALVEVVRLGPLLPPTARRFVVTSAGVARARLGGVSPLNRFARAQEEMFQGHAQARAFNLMYDHLQYALQRAIGKVSLPAI